MDLIDEQLLMINLCTDGKFRRIFFGDPDFRHLWSKTTSSPDYSLVFHDSAEYQFEFQLIATNNMLYDSYYMNMESLFKHVPNMRDIFHKYSLSYPIKLRNKYEEYIRFLSFVSSEIWLASYATKIGAFNFVLDIIRYYNGLFLCALQRDRYALYLDSHQLLFERQASVYSEIVVNPTLVLTTLSFPIRNVISGDVGNTERKLLKVKTTNIAMHYLPGEAEVNITVLNHGQLEFLNSLITLKHTLRNAKSNINKFTKQRQKTYQRQFISDGILFPID